jgi:DNA-directed RNA polymerase I, II, and III subunit RPABC1
VFHTSVATIKKNDLFNAADDASHVIVVFHTKAQGTTTRSIISEGISKKMTFEFFDMTSLQYNVTKHKYVPKHEKVPQEEIDGILKRYYLKSKFHLPIIIETDPIARYLGIKHGDLVKITRPSMNTGVTTIFRCCKA